MGDAWFNIFRTPTFISDSKVHELHQAKLDNDELRNQLRAAGITPKEGGTATAITPVAGTVPSGGNYCVNKGIL